MSLPLPKVQIPKKHARPFAGNAGRACVYSRVSGESDLRTISLETQAQGSVDAACRDNFWLTPEDARFERYSGVNSVARRVVLLDILKDMEAGKYQAFYIHDPDRLVRGIEIVYTIKQIEAAGAVVYIDGKPRDTSPEGDLLLCVGGYASGKEAVQISERTTRTRLELAERGEWLGVGGPRYGYTFDKAKRERFVQPEHAATVVRIFERVAAGVSTIQLAKILNAEGIPAPGVARTSKKRIEAGIAKKYQWSAARVGFIVREETYLGKAYRNRYRYRRDAKGAVTYNAKNKKVLEAVPREEWVETAFGKTPPLVAQDLWDRANAALDGSMTKKKIDRTRNETAFYLLRGLIFCEGCGQRMHTTQTSGCAGGVRTQYRVYRCRTKYNDFHGHGGKCDSPTVHADRVEKHVRNVLDALLQDEAFVDSSIDLAYRPDGTEETLARELGRTRENVKKLEGQMAAMADDLSDGDLGPLARRAIREKMRMTEEQVTALQSQAEEYAATLAPLADRERTKAGHKARVAEVREKLAGRRELSDEEYRMAMEGLGVRVTFAKPAESKRSHKMKIGIELQPGVEISASTNTVLLASSSARRWKKNSVCRSPFRPVKIDVRLLLEPAYA